MQVTWNLVLLLSLNLIQLLKTMYRKVSFVVVMFYFFISGCNNASNSNQSEFKMGTDGYRIRTYSSDSSNKDTSEIFISGTAAVQ